MRRPEQSLSRSGVVDDARAVVHMADHSPVIPTRAVPLNLDGCTTVPYRTCAAIVCHGSTVHQSTHENGGAMAPAQSKSHVLALTSGKANTPWTLARPDTTCKSCTHDRVMYEPWAPTDQPCSRDSSEKDHWSFGTVWRYQYTLQHLQSASHIKQTIYKRTPYHEPMANY